MVRVIFIYSVIFVVILIIPSYSSEETSADIFPYFLGMHSPEKANDLRSQFLKRKHERKENQKKLNLLDKNLPKTFYYDGIPHFEIKKKNRTWKKVYEMEKAFRRMIAMYKVKYIYNRGGTWRTWREVNFPNGEKRIFYYYCKNYVNITCVKCHNGGYWLLDEELPPCPYEIFSVENKNKLCAANTKQLQNMNNPCPSTISFEELTQTCMNPIETEYRVTRVYSSLSEVSERDPNDICIGRENCQILTSYEIKPDLVVFRIINKTSNEIKFSRIMKNDRSMFACTDECGNRDPITKKVTKNEKPLVLNLLKPHKSKRENNKNGTIVIKGLKRVFLGEQNSNSEIKDKSKIHTHNVELYTMDKQKNSEKDIYVMTNLDEVFDEYSNGIKVDEVTAAPCCKNVTHKYEELDNGSSETEDDIY